MAKSVPPNGIDVKQSRKTLRVTFRIAEREIRLLSYEQDYYAGSPAITQNRFGKGNAFYAGTVSDASGMNWLMEIVCESAGIKPIVSDTPTGVEILKRVDGNSSWLFVLNYSSNTISMRLETDGSDLLTGMEVKNYIELEPSGVAIIQE